jgi:hypothetical protein
MNPASLDALRDIHVPAPPALTLVAWWVAGAMLVLLMLLALLWHARRRQRRRLRAALRELAALAATHASDGDGTRLAGGLSRLLRQYAMARFPDAGLAALTGPPWLQFLDAHGGQGGFCGAPGAALEFRPYQCRGEFDAPALLALVRRWLKANPQ